MILMWACRACQKHLLAYIHHELSPVIRWRVARHLDGCERCYATYLQQLDFARQLTDVLPLVGEGTTAQFDRVWRATQAEMSRPVPARPVRFGFAAAMLTLMLLVPMTLGNQNLTLAAPPTQPAPLTQRATPEMTEVSGTAVALQMVLGHDPLSTPEAPQKATGPVVAVFNTP